MASADRLADTWVVARTMAAEARISLGMSSRVLNTDVASWRAVPIWSSSNAVLAFVSVSAQFAAPRPGGGFVVRVCGSRGAGRLLGCFVLPGTFVPPLEVSV